MESDPKLRFDEPEEALHRSRTRESAIPEREVTYISEKAIGVSDEENGLGTQEQDYKKKQVFSGWLLGWLAYQATGVIYGDIGTSPLYVYSSTFTSDPSYEDLLGALSLIIWTLTLIVTVKYVFIVLQADDAGEGGTFAVYSLLSRYSNIMKRDPKTNATVKFERYSTNEMRPTNLTIRGWLENSRISHGILKAVAVFGVALIMADGVLTPAQSVLGSIQGLEVVASDISSSTIIGVTCAILILLFVFQSLGITKLGSAFAPVVLVWLTFNLVFGIYNLIKHDHSVLKAFSPYFAGAYFVRNKTDGWKSLGGILLAFTGVETLFADLGAFSKRAIQLSWICFVYPCLLLAYIGQAAYISDIPSAYSNPFFNCVPPGMFWPSLVVAILATVVASQAVITGTFQLLIQVMHASYFPQIKSHYTSTNFHGQVYIPIANWLLMIGTVVVTAVYSNTTRLGEAYGVCVVLVTTVTTCMIALVAILVWRMHLLLVFAVWLPFITLDGLYLSSAMTKFPNGAWFTLLLAVVLASVFILWRYGKEQQWAAETRQKIPIHKLIVQDTSTSNSLSDSNPSVNNTRLRLATPLSSQNNFLTAIQGLGIFFDKAGEALPASAAHFISKFEALPEVCIFLHMRALQCPSVPEETRFAIAPSAQLPNAYRLVIRHGYKDKIVNHDLGNLVYLEVRKHIIARNVNEADTAARLAMLDRAHGTQTVYMVGKEQLRILGSNDLDDDAGFVAQAKHFWRGGVAGALRRCLLGMFLWVRENSRTKVAAMKIPVEKLVEVGFVLEI